MTEQRDPFDMIPPNDLDCEQAVLSCALQNGAAADWAVANLRGEDFYREAHQFIFTAIRNAREQHGAADLTLVVSALRAQNKLDAAGGTEYLTAILHEQWETMTSAGPHYVQKYGRTLKGYSRSRMLMAAALATLRAIQAAPGDNERIAQVAQEGVLRAMETGALAGRVEPVSAIAGQVEAWLEAERAEARAIHGMRTALPSVDWHLGGLYKQRLVLVKGESKAGKTTLAGQIVFATVTARDVDGAVLAFILESGKLPFLRRFIAWQAQVPRYLLDRGGASRSTPEQTARIRAAYQVLPQLNLLVHDQIRDIGGIEAEVRNAAMRGPVAGVLVDYAQLVTGGNGGRGGNDEPRYRDIAERLQVLATETGCPVVVPSQITVQQSGEVTEKGARAFGDNCTLSIYVMRGEMGDAKYERQRSPVMRVVCDAARDDEPFAPVRCVAKLDMARVDEEEDATEREGYDSGDNRDRSESRRA